MNEEDRTRIALFRLGVLGPLISARLDHGDRADHFRAAAERTWQLPDGRRIEVSARTAEAWYYAWRQGGLEALRPGRRTDAGKSRAVQGELGELILRLKREKLRRSVRRIIRLLERAGRVRRGELSKSSVHRFLAAHGLSGRPTRGTASKERRAFRHGSPGDLWMGDVMHSREVIATDGRLRKAYLHIFIDSATRLVPHAAFRLGEKARDFEAIFKQAIMKHHRPRAIYVDRGAAQIAESLRLICGELSIRLIHCEARDPEAKAGVERMIRTCREEVEEELPEEPMPLSELNSYLWSWLAVEYHVRTHQGTGRAPLEHWLAGAQALRPLPTGMLLDEVFLHRKRCKVRKDSTVRFKGGFLEVRSELVGHSVELRYDPERPDRRPRVFIEGRFFCDTVPLDPIANSERRRRRHKAPSEPPSEPTGLDPLQLMRDEHTRRVRRPGNNQPRKEK